ncbi:MAG TPA: FAD-dependent oxidoreductase [Puia sp.]|nr:FAD-dependent oxidoreductase [Puia sp.]
MKKAIIIGAGPAGLTAAYELLTRTDIKPVILEKSGEIGGISRTINYKGNRMDMGPHRFFSKSDRVMDWWLKMMPMEGAVGKPVEISYHNKKRAVTNTGILASVDSLRDAASDTLTHKDISIHENTSTKKETSMNGTGRKDPDKVMLVIQRLTRIYFLRKFFAYPIQLGFDTLKTLGLIRTVKILFSFLWVRLFPRKPEKSLEDFIINKFGRQLYLLFFKDYTEKVWGVPCHEISAEWGAQRIKGVSLSKAIGQAIKSLGKKKIKGPAAINQKETETSLIEQFLYPKYGPGSLWEEVARQVQEMGGEVRLNQDVKAIYTVENEVCSVHTADSVTGELFVQEGDYFFSTMPVKELIADMGDKVPPSVQEVAAGLQYRDFINVGILLTKLSAKDGRILELKDNWIYIQERDVKVGRLMIYNNWGTGMIKDPNTVWIGMEYFCNKEDTFWAHDDATIQGLAVMELEKMDLARVEDVLDITVRRMEKTYPAYFGTYSDFGKIREYTDGFTNLFLIGRNGMHKYNNADHSMLTAMVAVDNIIAGVMTKENLWKINTEMEYHEEKSAGTSEVGVSSEAGAVGDTGRPSEDTDNTTRSTAKKKKRLEPSLSSDWVPPASFKDWLLHDRLNRTFLWVAGIAIVVQFVIFKIMYPYAGFIDGDSYVYLESAFYNYDINTYPIGYSKFLRLFSVFTRSDTVLVAFQFLSIQLSALWFVFTLFFFHKPGRLTKWLMFSFVVFNPVFFYLSNYVSSDSIFLALSLVWFTLLLWILQRPMARLIALQVVVLFLAFTVRYNAMYYPLIAGLVFILSKQSLKRKLAGIGASLAVIAIFILVTSYSYKKITGIRQFTPFSGWQIANNAMYAYRYIDSQQVKKTPAKFIQLDKMVRHYFDTTRDLKTHPVEMLVASTVYMWDPHSPLQKFMNKDYKKDTFVSDVVLRRWATVGPLYADYGAYLIRQYPLTFIQNYLWPNALKYYAPPGEFLDTYNAGKDSVHPIAQTWFNYKTRKVKNAFKDLSANALGFLPILAGIMNVVFLTGFLFVWLLKGLNRKSTLSATLLLAITLWAVNFGFSVFASPVTLRYQLFGILIFSSFAFILIDYIYKVAFVIKS